VPTSPSLLWLTPSLSSRIELGFEPLTRTSNLLIKRRAKSYIISLHLVVKLRVRVVLCCTSYRSM
jgi:hypothetical protein